MVKWPHDHDDRRRSIGFGQRPCVSERDRRDGFAQRRVSFTRFGDQARRRIDQMHFVTALCEPCRVRPRATANVDHPRGCGWEESSEHVLGPLELELEGARGEARLLGKAVVVIKHLTWRTEHLAVGHREARLMNDPEPARPTNLPPSMMTRPREMTVSVTPTTSRPSYGL